MIKASRSTVATEMISIGNQRLELYPSVNLRQGEMLLACGTPFGALCPPVFMNSMSTGIVTNLAGKNNALIMTDARVMPGSEGAGLYVLPHGNFKQRKLVGMIVSPLCWKVNEWIGLTLAVSISTLLDSLQKLNPLQSQGSMLPSIVNNGYKDLLTSDVRKAINSVVYVQVGPIWGSGVMVDGVEGYVITCRHVVKNSRTRGVRIFIRYPRPMWIAADVVFSACNSSPIDLALLKLKHCPEQLQSVKPSNNITKGQKVIAVGHALFGFEIQKQPSVTSGIVSNTVKYKHQLVMVQSTCAVHSGASGGALLCAETGHLIGIIASNSRDIDTNASFPHVNFSIPVSTFWLAIKSYIQSTDIHKLDILNNTNSSIRHLWQLDAPEININSKL
ncbi:peroxisomal leader peptide-processing protease-like isoform X2 [Anneissia japonica]|uniref:peroxisomal leader peptide-processing protease-like isoform X2 n=1 Tax=Anneissia japonica TaxID=1529436 RepID=UPI001425B03A|nr:peroxisomal leader peptide-processing protease-like isoform X2 [Anneissia japonica]